MSSQIAKLKKKLAPPPVKTEETSGKRDKMLIFLMVATALIMVLGYESMNGISLTLYVAIMTSIVTLFLSRKPFVPEKMQLTCRYISIIALAAVFVLMIYGFYTGGEF